MVYESYVTVKMLCHGEQLYCCNLFYPFLGTRPHFWGLLVFGSKPEVTKVMREVKMSMREVTFSIDIFTSLTTFVTSFVEGAKA